MFPNAPNLEILPNGFNSSVLSDSPLILRLDNAMLDDEIEAFIKMASGKFSRSTIVVNGKLIHSTTRTSQTAFVTANGQKGTYSKPVERFIKRITFLLGCKRSQMEGLMVVKYEPGEEYSEHWDFFEADHKPQLASGGQRIATFFFYLNDMIDSDSGGETKFPRIGLEVTPRKGSAAFWWNQIDGQRIRDTEHCGAKVKRGVKYGLNVWVREKGWD